MASRLYSHLLGTPEDHVLSLTTIVTREPMMQYVIDLLNNLCLKNGVVLKVSSSKPTTEFNDFFQQYFVSMLPNVLRYKLYCGFIPWVIHKHPVTGDCIPVVLPLGSFSWHVRTKQMDVKKRPNGSKGTGKGANNSAEVSQDSSKKRKTTAAFASGLQSRARMKQSESSAQDETNGNLEHNCASEYVVQCTGNMGVDASDIYIINLIDPMMVFNTGAQVQGSKDQNGNNACLGQAQFSPLYVPLQKYLALDIAQQRRCYADDWNTTARLFTTKNPPMVQNERAGRDEIPYGTTRFQQAQMPEGFFTYDNMKLQYQNNSDMLRDALEQTGGRGSEHVPSVYALPAHYNMVTQPELKPLQDIALLEKQYRISIAHSLGMPLHMIDSESGTSRNMTSEDLPFSSEMVKNTCESLLTLMRKVLLHTYSAVYYEEHAAKIGPVTTSRVDFTFAAEELYSKDMKQREDQKIVMQKGPTTTASNRGS